MLQRPWLTASLRQHPVCQRTTKKAGCSYGQLLTLICEAARKMVIEPIRKLITSLGLCLGRLQFLKDNEALSTAATDPGN